MIQLAAISTANIEPYPASLAGLSADLLVLRSINDMQQSRGRPVLREELVGELTKRKLATEDIVCDALDVLFDQGMVRADWTKDESRRPVRGLVIAGEAQRYVKILAEKTAKLT